MDSCQIISGSELKQLLSFKTLFLSGWIVALLMTLALTFAVGEMYSMFKLMPELKEFEMGLIDVQSEQKHLTSTFVKAWKNQQATANILISWGKFIIEKKGIQIYNRDSIAELKATP
jgi:hypothetical protein